MVPVELAVKSLEERLKAVPSPRLYVRLDVARGVLENATGDAMRHRALAEIKAIRAELSRRQCEVETQW